MLGTQDTNCAHKISHCWSKLRQKPTIRSRLRILSLGSSLLEVRGESVVAQSWEILDRFPTTHDYCVTPDNGERGGGAWWFSLRKFKQHKVKARTSPAGIVILVYLGRTSRVQVHRALYQVTGVTGALLGIELCLELLQTEQRVVSTSQLKREECSPLSCFGCVAHLVTGQAARVSISRTLRYCLHTYARVTKVTTIVWIHCIIARIEPRIEKNLKWSKR